MTMQYRDFYLETNMLRFGPESSEKPGKTE